MMKAKTILCYLRDPWFQIKVWLQSGNSVDPCMYVEQDPYEGYVCYTKNSCRETDSYLCNNKYERVTRATITKAKCKHCGKEIISWTKYS